MKTAKDLKIPFAWEERRPILLDRFFYIPAEYAYSKVELPFFEESRPLVIEYCSGNGEWIGQRAMENPHFHWIAVEKKFARARKIWLKSYREKIENLLVVCGSAETFTEYYAPMAAEIYINFPDPWPKLRHAKHRLVQGPFLRSLSKIVVSGGRAVCVTDDSPYAAQMIEAFAQCPEWKFSFHVPEWPSYGNSFFKNLWIQKGHAIHYLSHERL